MSDCTEYSISDDYDPHNPAHCPVCKGFLKWVEKEGEGLQPVCNKCHAPLVTIPDPDSEEDWEFGKICVLKSLSDVPDHTPEGSLTRKHSVGLESNTEDGGVTPPPRTPNSCAQSNQKEKA